MRDKINQLCGLFLSRRSFSKAISSVRRMVPEVVFVLGAPGSGKGTQCENIVREFGLVHLSAGDLLREERQRPGSEYGEMIEEKIRNGLIVPVEVTCSLIEQAIRKSGKKRFLIDGFPRNEDNLAGWTRAMGEKAKLLFVLFLECPREACTKRCLGRGAAGSGRSDDNIESLKKRFDTYLNDTMPIIKHYEKLDMVKSVDASLESDKVFENVRAVFQKAGISKDC